MEAIYKVQQGGLNAELYKKITAYILSNVVSADAQKQQKLNVINYKHE